VFFSILTRFLLFTRFFCPVLYYWAVLSCTVLCCTVRAWLPYCTVLYSWSVLDFLHCSVLYYCNCRAVPYHWNIKHYCTVVYYTAAYCTIVLCLVVLRWTVLHYCNELYNNTVLFYCTVLYWLTKLCPDPQNANFETVLKQYGFNWKGKPFRTEIEHCKGTPFEGAGVGNNKGGWLIKNTTRKFRKRLPQRACIALYCPVLHCTIVE